MQLQLKYLSSKFKNHTTPTVVLIKTMCIYMWLLNCVPQMFVANYLTKAAKKYVCEEGALQRASYKSLTLLPNLSAAAFTLSLLKGDVGPKYE